MLLLFSVFLTNAQELVGSSGGSFENANYSMDWSVGEIATSTYTAGDLTISEGLHQNFIEVEAINEIAEFGINIFPNPTTSFVTISSTEIDDFEVQITDLSGKKVSTQNVVSNQTEIDFSNYANGVYMLSILKNNQVQTFKIIKN